MAVHCVYCRRRIGWLRAFWDRSYCSSGHRRLACTHSSRELRDSEDVLAYYERWSDEVIVAGRGKAPSKTGFIFIGLAISSLASIAVFGSKSGQNATPVANSSGYTLDSKPSFGGGISRVLDRLGGNSQALNLRTDFQGGLAEWKDFHRGGDWQVQGTHVRTGGFRIWRPSAALANYEFEFLGQIERKSMNWAFRAADPRNYYATKLVIGPQSKAALVRYVVLDGRALDRIELPLPLTLSRNTDYRVQMKVVGTQFLTSIEGQVVSSWTDRRISRGGVGFFSEDGESALLKWASVSERDSLAGRIFSHFSLFLLPSAM